MTRKGVWNLQQTRDKSLQSLWANNSEIWGCGNNTGDYGGVLGNNEGGPAPSGTRYSSPVQLTGDNSEWSRVENNPGVSMYALKTDGTLWGWGRGHRGQFGLNNTQNYSSPVQIGGAPANNVIDYSSVNYTAGWINSDNELWMCGHGNFGQLANSKNETTPVCRFSSPVQVPGTNWSKISGGGPGRFYTAIKTNGEMWTWGANGNGQLGQNETAPNNENGYSSPVQIPGTTWSKVYCGGNNVRAIKTDGSLWVWGVNNQAQLGLNNKTSYSSPIQVPGTWANVKFAKGNGNNRFYVETDGSLYQSGQNYSGNIGNNTQGNTFYSSPIQIPGTWSTDYRPSIDNNTSVSAIKSDGTVWVWGANEYGQFGINNLVDYSSPVQLGGTTEFKWTDVTITQQVFGGIRNTLTGSQE